MAEVGAAWVSLVPSAKGFGRQMETQVRTEVDHSGKKVGGFFGNALKKGALAVTAAAGGVLGAALFKGFKRLDAIDQAKAKLTGLGNSTKTVDKIMTNALASVQGTAFGLDAAATTAAGAVAAGVKPGQELERTLKLVADAATIAGTDMGEMGSIFNKIAAGGVIQGEELAQLGDRGIPILALLSKELGVSTLEVKKLASEGKIGFAEFQNAMETGLGGAALESGKTFTGAFKNMQAALGRVGANLLSGIFPQLKGGLNGITGVLARVEPIALRAGEAIGDGLARAVDSAKTVAKAFQYLFNGGEEGIRGFAEIMDNAFGNTGKLIDPIARLTEFLKTMLKASVDVRVELAQRLAPAFSLIGGFLRDNPLFAKAFAASLGVLVGVIGAVTAATTLFSIALNTTGIPIVVIAIAALVAGLVVAYQQSEAFRSIVQQAGAELAVFGQWVIGTAVPAVVAFTQQLAANLQPTLVRVGEILRQIGEGLVEFAGWVRAEVVPVVLDLAQKVAGNLRPVFEQLWQTFQTQILPTVEKVIAKFREWQPTIQKVAGVVVQLVAKWADFYTTIVGKVLPVVIRLAGWLISKGVPAVLSYVEAVAKIIKKLYDFGSAIVDAIADVVRFAQKVNQKITDVIKWFQDLPRRVKDALGDLGSLLFDAGASLINGLLDGIKSKASSVTDAVSGIANNIKGFFGGSPVEHGPLLPWNTGTPGKVLMGMLAKGIRDGGASVNDAMTDVTTNLTDLTDKQLGAMRDKIKSRLDEMKSAFDSLRDSVKSAFAPDLFGAETLEDFLSGGRASGHSLHKLLAALKKLKKIPGITQGFIASLFSSGNTALILELADAPKSDVLEAQGVFQQNQSLTNQLGNQVATEVFGKGIGRLEKRLENVEKAIKHVGKDVAKAMNGVASDGHRRRVAAT